MPVANEMLEALQYETSTMCLMCLPVQVAAGRMKVGRTLKGRCVMRVRSLKTRRYVGGLAVLSVAGLMLAGCADLDIQGKGAALAKKDAQTAVDEGGAPLRLARAARDVGDFSSAADLYKRVLASKPNDAAVLAELGTTQLEMGAIYDGIDTFNKIPSADPAFLDAQIGLERAQLMLSNPEKALEYADKAVAIAPKNSRALVGRGVALDMLARHPEAQAQYQAALAITPHDMGATSNLALSLAMTGQYDQAIRLLTPIARAPNATSRIRQNLALIYGLKGDDEAARALNRVDLDEQMTEKNLQFYAAARERVVK